MKIISGVICWLLTCDELTEMYEYSQLNTFLNFLMSCIRVQRIQIERQCSGKSLALDSGGGRFESRTKHWLSCLTDLT
jgi:hypothetical protein